MSRVSLTIALLMSLILSVVTTIASAGINDGLVAYYPFNGNANDASGNGYDGVVNGATLAPDSGGKPNSAYYFDGSSSIAVGNSLKKKS